MSLLPHQLELLAPARTADIGMEAINHGADAVYIGGPSFGARSSAENTVADIARLVSHAHRFHSRIFVTINTILRDDELEGARCLIHQLYDAGVDALIIQDMGLLELDLPPIQLHASTQCDIRTPEKARFLQDAGLSQLVLARELTLQQIQAVRAATDPARSTLEFFVHGALCVAYSGQCFISHAHTGRSANRGDCSQACRLPYQVVDPQGRFIAHDKHVLSMKDNNQSANLAALVEAGIRSFKIEGRYKDLAYVKNITAHYRTLMDEVMEQREGGTNPLARASSGRTTFTFTPDPNQNFNREFTDYFVQGRKEDIGAFDTPKNPGLPIGWVTQLAADHLDVETTDRHVLLNNGDGLCYYNLHKDLVGLAINRAERLGASGAGRWRLFPKDAMASFKDLRKGTEINRNRDMNWVRVLDKKSSDRRIGLWMHLHAGPHTLTLTLTDEDGISATASTPFAATPLPQQPAASAPKASPLRRADPAPDAPSDTQARIREALLRLGTSVFEARDVQVAWAGGRPGFVPASTLNALRREAVAALESARLAAWQRPAGPQPAVPAPLYPDDTLTYLANVYNDKARAFYARHGVKVIAAAYESQEEEGEVSLMITKHCVRFSMSLCPKQAKGVTGVQGTVKAEPLQLINGKEKLTLRFDCKPCEMHVVGKMKKAVIQQRHKDMQETPLTFYRTRPQPVAAPD